ncbi:N-acetyltransferase esco2 [Mortierella sp. GBA30]|nr:N-acetyltransferase esco2 [Mortierella sp. GBA30]
MNTPAASRSSSNTSTSTGSDFGTSSGLETPKREYTFHKAIKNTYGRSTRSISDRASSSPDVWSSQTSATSTNNSPVQQRQRSRLSGSFSELGVYDSWSSPSRGTRTLTEKLAFAKLEFDSDNDDDDINSESVLGRAQKNDNDGDKNDDPYNIFKVQDANEKTFSLLGDSKHNSTYSRPKTPTKRKCESVEIVVPTRNSPRQKLSTPQEDNPSRDELQDRSRKSLISPRSSPSPSASPTQRNAKSGSVTIPTRVSPSTTLFSQKLKGTSTASSKHPTQQATISSFFTPKAGKGTGILKSKGVSGNNSKSNDVPSSTGSHQLAKTGASSGDSTVKLEQLFLSFSKDRTKSSSSPSKKAVVPSQKPKTALQREDEKTKRYHCPQCGMPYIRGQQEDEQIHDRYHRAVLGGIDYPGYKNEVVVARFNDLDLGGAGRQEESNGSSSSNGMTIRSKSISSSSKDSTYLGDISGSRIVMVKEVLQVVNEELGSVEFDPEQLEACKVFLYISGKKKVVGCVVAERIKQGFEVVVSYEGSFSLTSNPVNTKAMTVLLTPATSATEQTDRDAASKSDPTGHRSDEGSAVFCSTVPQPAICGINRIWVSAHYRRQKIASRLLDAVRDRFVYACKLETKDLAFSQPTGDGKALARQYLGTDRFLVYVE